MIIDVQRSHTEYTVTGFSAEWQRGIVGGYHVCLPSGESGGAIPIELVPESDNAGTGIDRVVNRVGYGIRHRRIVGIRSRHLFEKHH